jgi:hypothetical protein
MIHLQRADEEAEGREMGCAGKAKKHLQAAEDMV